MGMPLLLHNERHQVDLVEGERTSLKGLLEFKFSEGVTLQVALFLRHLDRSLGIKRELRGGFVSSDLSCPGWALMGRQVCQIA